MQIYRNLGFLSIALAWLAIGFVLYKWPLVHSKSISKHVSVYKESYWFNAVITSLSLLLFTVFMFKWFIPTYALPIAFKVILVIGIVFEFITAWVPDSHGIKHWVHHYIAYTAALLFPVLTWFIAASSQATILTKYIAAIATGYMMVIFMIFLLVKSAKKWHLIIQSSYILSFHIAILVAIFSYVH